MDGIEPQAEGAWREEILIKRERRYIAREVHVIVFHSPTECFRSTYYSFRF